MKQAKQARIEEAGEELSPVGEAGETTQIPPLKRWAETRIGGIRVSKTKARNAC